MNAFNLPAIGAEVGKRGIVLVFAPSERAPAYEVQMRLLDDELETIEAAGVLVVSILAQGESHVGSQRIEHAEADALRDAFDLAADAFQIIILGPEGHVVRQDDAPLQVSALMAAST